MSEVLAPALTDQADSVHPKAPLLIDCDVHNYPDSIDDLTPFLSERWRAYIKQSGFKSPYREQYPKGFEGAARRDAWPPNGKMPGSDPDFARAQLLDAWHMDYAILNPLYYISAVHNLDFANALMRAVNDWTAGVWLDSDVRWRASIVPNARDPQSAAEEIRRVGRDRRFVQVLLLVRSHAPYGRREFLPIFEAASEMDLAVGIHFGGGGHPITACGWPSYYIEDHTGMSQAFQSQVISLVCEGVLEKFPKTRIALIEGGFAWLPPLMWRLDKNYKGLRSEVPWLTRPPSDYILDHFRATTQPMEEPPNPQHLVQILDMIGREDFLLFATDYPHWDFDAPDRALPRNLPRDIARAIRATNATRFYAF